MAIATSATVIVPPVGQSGTGNPAIERVLLGFYEPCLLAGNGTPDGDLHPWKDVPMGSIYHEMNAADNLTPTWVKIDDSGASDNSDWVREGVVVLKSDLFDISAAASEQVLHFDVAFQIVDARLVWNEATPASGSLEGDITLGSSTGGAEIVAATSYPASQATGATTALTLVTGLLTAGQSLFISHDQASGSAGTCYVQLRGYYM